jgi:hypothetical protein
MLSGNLFALTPMTSLHCLGFKFDFLGHSYANWKLVCIAPRTGLHGLGFEYDSFEEQQMFPFTVSALDLELLNHYV